MQFNYRITFDSDWHIGSGTGRPGDVDKLVLRNQRGVPYVPAKTVAGVWRDAAEALASTLDQTSFAEGGETWSAVVDYLFGTQPAIVQNEDSAPVEGALRLSNASFDQQLQRALTRCPTLQKGLLLNVPSVQINRITGAAKESNLWLTEYVRKGAVLTGSAQLPDMVDAAESANTHALLDFLSVTAQGIRAMGAKKRKGKGSCTVHLQFDPDNGADSFERFFDKTMASPPSFESTPTVESASGATLQNTPAPEHWNVDIHLLEPTLIANETSGNIVSSLPIIPGAMILPALIGRLPQSERPTLFTELAENRLQVRNAYPLAKDANDQTGYRAIPTPFCLFKDKLSDNLKSRLMDTSEQTDLIQWKQQRSGFIPESPSGRGPLVVESSRFILNTHNVIDDAKQTPTEDVGGVFTYEALAEDQRFRALLVAEKTGAIGQLLAGLAETGTEFEMTLGSARRSGYGRARVSVSKSTQVAPPPCKNHKLLLWLASPLLMRQDTLIPVAQELAFEKLLTRQMGFTSVKLLRDQCWLRDARRNSWQRSWGLPRPTLVGWDAGSVLVCEVDSLTADQLSALQTQGLGERRAEGFGEVIVNPFWLTHPPSKIVAADRQCDVKSRVPSSEDVTALRGNGPYANLVLERAALLSLDDAVAGFLLENVWQKASSIPEAGYLSGLRKLLVDAPSNDLPSAVDEFRSRYYSNTEYAANGPLHELIHKILNGNDDRDSLKDRLLTNAHAWIDDHLWKKIRPAVVRKLILGISQSGHRALDDAISEVLETGS